MLPSQMITSSLPLGIALRYIKGKRGTGFVSFISWMSFLAMMLGVMALIVVMSVMNGFNREITERILRVVPHAEVSFDTRATDWQTAISELVQIDSVQAGAPYIQGYAMLSKEGSHKGVQVQGVAPEFEKQTTFLHQHLLLGSFDDLNAGQFGIVLGDILARSLGVVRGDKVLVSLPELNVTPVGVFPRFKRFTVVGIYSVGAQVDDGIAFIHLQDARKVFRKTVDVDGLRLKVTEPLNIGGLLEEIEQDYGDKFQIVTWSEKMSDLFGAIKMEKLVVGVLLSSIIAVAAFNIIASLVLMVADKRKELAVLRTLGADMRFVQRLVLFQGGVIGVVGVMLGAFLGSLVALYISDLVRFFEGLFGFYVFDPQVYFIQQLPSQLLASDVLIVVSAGVVLTVLASLYPAWRAGTVLPAEALRYDH